MISIDMESYEEWRTVQHLDFSYELLGKIYRHTCGETVSVDTDFPSINEVVDKKYLKRVLRQPQTVFEKAYANNIIHELYMSGNTVIEESTDLTEGRVWVEDSEDSEEEQYVF